ncbi:MAG: ferredoxin reductase [Candidatus Baltobacteraceae bacterium]
MAGTAVRGRLNWYDAKVVERRRETQRASTLVLAVPGWPGHDAGQHVDVRLRAADGYTAVRTYSIASAPEGERLELTIELMPDGEVSPYLVQSATPGSPLEILGPIGGWFVWRADSPDAVQLIAGGSGIVPLMAMIRTRARDGSRVPFRLLYSVRQPDAVIYADELQRRSQAGDGLTTTLAYTRAVPAGWPAQPKRIDAALVTATTIPASEKPVCYVCGPTGFVETVADLLTSVGHDPARIKTERFGPTAG